MSEQDIIDYFKREGFDSAEIFKTFNGEVVYSGTYKKEGFIGGFPIMITIRDNESVKFIL